MGYYMLPQADEVDVGPVVTAAVQVFVKKHGEPGGKLGAAVDLGRQIVVIADEAKGVSETFTFAELGFL